RRQGRREPPEAYRADALLEVVRHKTTGTTKKQPAWAKVLVRIDLPTLLRGHPLDGETCELVGYGPVAVSAVRDMIESGNPFLAAVATSGRPPPTSAPPSSGCRRAVTSRDAPPSPTWRSTT